MLFLSQNITGSRLKYNILYEFLLCYMCLTALVTSQITI